MSIFKRVILIFFVMVSCVSCDQATKFIAVSILPRAEPVSYLCDTVRLQVVHNCGAFLSLGSSLPEVWQQGIFKVGTGFLLLGALIFALLLRPGRPSIILAVALFFAGGLGNLIDRIAHDGSVVDFINIGIGPVRTGIFNVADIAIMVGVLIIFSTGLLQKKRTANKD